MANDCRIPNQIKRKLKELFKGKDFIACWDNIPKADESGEPVIDIGLTKFELAEEELKSLPAEIYGIKCRYWYPGKIELLSRFDRHDPMIGGISFGAIDITAGTLGGVVWRKETGEALLLTNEHVVSNSQNMDPDHPPIGHPILQPGPHDTGSLPDDIAGILLEVGGLKEAALNDLPADCDAAIVLPKRDVEYNEYWGTGHIEDKQFVDPEIGDRIVKIGRTTGLSGTEVHSTDVTIQMGGMAWNRVVTVEGVIQTTTSFLEGGDSGSRVWKFETREPVGLGFAGSPFLSFVIPARTIAERFNITFTRNGEAPPEEPEPWPEPEPGFLDRLIQIIRKIIEFLKNLFR